MQTLDKILEIVQQQSPRHAKKLVAYISGTDDTYRSRSADFLTRYVALLERQALTLEHGVRCYLDMCNQMLAEQIVFTRTGKYSCSSFAEVEARVYANPQVMDAYMYGLLLSQFLWRSHYTVLEFFIEGVEKLATEARSYLEIGPGHGLYLYEALQALPATASIVALDISESSLAMCEQLVGSERVGYICADFLAHTFDTTFDFIAMGEVIEHVEKPMALLSRLSECLSPNGVAFITAPANSPAIDHIYLFHNPSDIRSHLEAAGLEILSETSCCSEDIDMETALRRRIPTMYAAFVRRSSAALAPAVG